LFGPGGQPLEKQALSEAEIRRFQGELEQCSSGKAAALESFRADKKKKMDKGTSEINE
jgi:hypothetical protein